MDLPAQVSEFHEISLDMPLHLAVGMFDGVHLGHQAVIESAMHIARKGNGVAGVLTFSPHPSRILKPDNPTRLIMPDWIKARTLFDLGVELLITKNFTMEYSAIQAEDFVAMLKTAMPTLKSLHVGENFRFGKGRRGDSALLVEQARLHSINVFSIDRIKYNGQPISSSRIRGELIEGNIPEVNAMLGYPYYAKGKTIPGSKRGREMGFPTLNFQWEPELPPRYGVYAVTIRNEAAKTVVPGVANYGVRPTVTDDKTPVLEVHLLQSVQLDTSSEMVIDWHDFLRAEKKFANMEALSEQIRKDVDSAREVIKEGTLLSFHPDTLK